MVMWAGLHGSKIKKRRDCMGVSTDAILFYGFPFGDEGEEFPWHKDQYDNDWVQYYAEKIGIPIPTEEYSEETKKIFSEFWNKRNKAVEECECEIGIYCSYDYPMLYAAIQRFTVTTWRGDCNEVNTNRPVWPKEIDKLRDFCKLMGIEFQEPKWYMVRLWG
jgi:hypothetical protein